MKGHLRQRGEQSWQLLVFIGRDASGRRRYASKTVRGTKRQAQLALAKFVLETQAMSPVGNTEPRTVLEVVEAWLEARRPHFAPSTVERYRVAIRQLAPVIGSISVGKLRSAHIEDLYARLHGGGLSGSSIRKIHWAMRQSLAWAKRRGLVASLATEGIELPPLGQQEIAPPSSGAVRTLIKHALDQDPEFGALIAFLAWTGCRRGEACGLRWDDVDLAASTAVFRRSIVAVPGGVLEKQTKTGLARRIALGPKTARMLGSHRQHCEAIANAVGTDLDADALVFSPDPAGRCPWHPSTVSHAFVAACKNAGVPPMRMHDLRHHSATALLKNGASVGEVMDRHGWQTLEMVARYRHLLEATDQRAATALEESIGTEEPLEYEEPLE